MTVVALAVGLCSVTGCAPTLKTTGIERPDVVSIELFQHTWGDGVSDANRATIIPDDPASEIPDELVDLFIDVPVSRASQSDLDSIEGREALTVRYTLQTGETVVVARVVRSRQDVIVMWPDDSVTRTRWGSPDTFEYYSEVGVVESVAAGEVPRP